MAISGIIEKVNTGGNEYLIASTAYGICDTAAGVAAKIATIQDNINFNLIEGVTVHIKFINSNAISNPTLNINETGAKYIYRYDLIPPGISEDTSWKPGSVLSLTYDGSYWIINGTNRPSQGGGSNVIMEVDNGILEIITEGVLQ